MKIIKQITLLITFLATIAGLWKMLVTLTKARDPQTLVVGTSADYPPYAYVDIKKDMIVGFDIDIVREVVSRLHKKIEVVDIPFTALMLDLFFKSVDVVAAGITPTETRARKVLFSKSYLQADPLIVLTKKGGPSIKELHDLKGKTVVVNTGYTADLYLSEKPGMDLMKLKAPAECFMALKSGRADALVCAKSSLAMFVGKNTTEQFNMIELPNTGDTYSLAVNKADTELLHEINKALDDMDKDGTLENLKKKWNLV